MPCNQSHELVPSSFLPPSTLTIKFMEQLVLHCDKDPSCKQGVYLSDLRAHIKSNCKHTSNIQSAVTVAQILEQPTDTPPTKLEMRTAGHVVQKILAQSKEPFSLPTHGNVSPVYIDYLIRPSLYSGQCAVMWTPYNGGTLSYNPWKSSSPL